MHNTKKDISRVIISRQHLKKIQSVKIYDNLYTYKKRKDVGFDSVIAAVLYDIHRTGLQNNSNTSE